MIYCKYARRRDKLGYKTIVLQGGEDAFYTDEKMVEIIKAIKKELPNNALTLSIGERSYDSYKKLYEAGADRFLLRHESATKRLYDLYIILNHLKREDVV